MKNTTAAEYDERIRLLRQDYEEERDKGMKAQHAWTEECAAHRITSRSLSNTKEELKLAQQDILNLSEKVRTAEHGRKVNHEAHMKEQALRVSMEDLVVRLARLGGSRNV